jgi:ketosteroid isomerase-like protein
MRFKLAFAMCLWLIIGCSTGHHRHALLELKAQVQDTERAFAKTMKDRDHAGFGRFVSEEAIFFSSKKVLHGKERVASGWKHLFEKPDAPFSWEPEQVEVLPSGTLALSTGPVRDTSGKLVSTYTSIWRLEEPGVWRIIFDKGNEVCPDDARKSL